MSASAEPKAWDARETRAFVAVPGEHDDKYSRGVLTLATGSLEYPGAAVLSVEAACRTGVGMARYVGPPEPTRLVVARRPEVVVRPGATNAVVAGSGVVRETIDPSQLLVITEAIASRTPLVCDAGLLEAEFLERVRDAGTACVITPHAAELARVLSSLGESVSPLDVSRDPEGSSALIADRFGVVVLLKGSHTHIVGPDLGHGARFRAQVSTTNHWMATAGTGDVLAGILGALIATQHSRVREDLAALGGVAASAAWLHARAGELASAGGPLVALEVAQSVSRVVTEVLA